MASSRFLTVRVAIAASANAVIAAFDSILRYFFWSSHKAIGHAEFVFLPVREHAIMLAC
jgi:hypothetical protein